ncbi:hypothetical protein AAE02nite_14480 [Adhaeribacter aerolatus]|uniref:STAS/SEC14 domain-containing protein n=1 Tax=Adhaeribacter aerolatus TaxID=670289 RepID=A0A512AVP8_9BACT|nr:hypothetical protein [Adhaeribacter aerolatus]GEO03784.1 hypothetical protein AAE02nite_14480 [Adhaeribacter aerolatus]
MRREVKNQGGHTFLVLDYDQENNWLYLNWIGYQNLFNIKQGLAEAWNMFRRYRFSKVLNDNRELVGPWDKANDWLEEELNPASAPIRIKYVAHIISPGIFGQLSIQDLQTRLINKVEIKLFEDINRAQDWLKSK